MKLLLTSTGVTNKSIHRALEELLGKPTKQSKIAFIPTAAYGADSNKSWLVKELQVAYGLGWQNFNVVEISALDKDSINEQLSEADVIHMNGGNAYFLMNRIINSGLEELLPELLKTKIYLSSSAGGIVTSKYFPSNLAEAYGKDEDDKLEQGTVDHGLGLVDFVIKPHLNSAAFPNRTMEWYEEVSKKINAPFYAIDDQTAIKVVDGKVEVVSEGTWKLFNA